jgi:2-methylcitrate dehydratase PrpD
VGYRTALLDWLACAVGGRDERAAVAARSCADGVEGRVAAAATAGHVLDFDDTYAPGLAHLSAPTAPAAIVLGAHIGATVGDVIDAYAKGFEAMAALTRANHPQLRERGWHPTAVCGVVGAAVAAGALLGTEPAELAALSASGLRAAFGSDGKALQVGAAAAAGVRAARLAAAGATAPVQVATGFEAAYGGTWVAPEGSGAIEQNWIKAYPCCLQTHSAIDAALAAGAGDEVVVHPVSLTAASLDDVETGLQAKFSIPYLAAYAMMRGAPTVQSFRGVDDDVRARRLRVTTDDSLLESEAVLLAGGEEVARVKAAVGSPANPMPPDAHAHKIRSLAGARLDGILDDPDAPAAVLESALGAADRDPERLAAHQSLESAHHQP